MQKYPIPTGAIEVEIPDPVFTIEEPEINQPPTANAGSDIEITLPADTVMLQGRGSDPDGLVTSFRWTKVSGSGTILAPNAANTEVTDHTQGTSVFRLTVTDDKGATKTDDVNVKVNAAPIVVPSPGKYEGFGVLAASVADQSNVILVDSKSKFEASLGSNRILRFTRNLTFTGRYELGQSNLMIDAGGFDVRIDNNNNGDGISIFGNKIILLGITVTNAGNDGINVVGGRDIIIANCSSYDNRDGNIDIAGGRNVSVLNCFIGKGKSGFSGCMLVTSQYVSVFGCFISPLGSPNEGERCPLVHCNYSSPANPNVDFRNNVVWRYGRSGGTGSGYGTAICYNARGNVVNNYYFDEESANKAICKDDGYGSGNNGQIYSAGNYITNGKSTLSPSLANNHAEFTIPEANKLTMLSAIDAAKKVKAEVGPAVKNSYEKTLIDSINV